VKCRKNLLPLTRTGREYIYNAYKYIKTCGVVEEDDVFSIMKIAEPLGVIAVGNPYYKPNLNCHFQDPAILKDKTL